MTPRMSVRAAAREIYGELAERASGGAGASAGATRIPDPSPQGGGETRVPQPGKQPYTAPSAVSPELMAQVRALYEDSAVPIREIAARAGVTERTLYKYACKGQWRPRYLRSNASACMLMRGWRAAEGFAPVTGAGGRFVRREDGGKPFAKGLKALDPAARAKADAECAEAARLSQEALQQAERERLRRERFRAITLMNKCMDDILRYRDENPPGRRDPEVEELLLQVSNYSIDDLRAARLACEQFESRMKAASDATNPADRA